MSAQFPLINGVRASFPSTSLRFGPPINFVADGAFKSINYGRKRTRGFIQSNTVDPVAKTRGQSSYKCDMEILVAEFYNIVGQLGPGWADVAFSIFLTINEAASGFPVTTDEIRGCTFDEDESGYTVGPEGLWIKIADFSPLKLLRNGIEDTITPLVPPTGQ